MTTLLLILFSCFVIMCVSLIGVIFLQKQIGTWLVNRIHYFVSFSAGVFFIVCIHLMQEALELSQGQYVLIITSFLVGFILFALMNRLFPEGHHHHETSQCEATHTKTGAYRMLIGDGVHNLIDGIILAPVFLVDIALGFVMTISIIIHEIVQELSEFFVLKEAGYTTKQALTRNFFVSSTILVGAMLGYLVSVNELLISLLIALGAGFFFYIVIADLLPKSYRKSKKDKQLMLYVFLVFLGAFVLFLFQYFDFLHHD